MGILLKHENVIFEDQTIYMTGSAYVGCTFRRCVIISVGASNGVFDGCHFENCIWHVNAMVHDQESWDAMQEVLLLVRKCLPALGPRSFKATPN